MNSSKKEKELLEKILEWYILLSISGLNTKQKAREEMRILLEENGYKLSERR